MYLFIRAIELEILTALLDLFVLHSLGRRLHLLREILGVHLDLLVLHAWKTS